ncbi:MAG: sensor histidine kinase [Bacteroidales bacterium]|nr:sensor histidine kinase [Bacteroidales bacterium]
MTALLPYPYKMFPSDSLSDGSIFHIPTFCKQNYSSCKCQQFYNNCVSEGIKQCPYGFAVDVFKVGGQTMILSCLNVDRISDKKAIQKRLRDRDFLPRIPYNSYIQSKTSICSLVEESSDFFQQESNFKKTKATYDEKTEMLDDTFHELRKLNQQLKPAAERLILELDYFDGNDPSQIEYYTRQLHATSQLISIRLSTYDLSITSDFSVFDKKGPIAIYKKFDKVSKLLEGQANDRHLKIVLKGESYRACRANDLVELLPYLLLDNAIKYSMCYNNIFVIFEEEKDSLIVSVKSLSQRPDKKEIPHLKERGFRSKHNSKEVGGKGIGLYLADLICINSDITMDISIGDRIDEDITGQKYSDFIVRMDFSSILLPTYT